MVLQAHQRTILFVSIAVVSTLGLVFLFYAPGEQPMVRAAASANVSGWIWSDLPNGADEVKNPGAGLVGRGAGWISLNSVNCDPDGDGKSNGTPTGCPPAGTGIANYGVHIDPPTGDFSGYAWSEHMGWMRFDPLGPYPEPPNYSAKLDLKKKEVSGWARACAVFVSGCSGALRSDGERGGWDGWIKLRGTTSPPGPTAYGVSWTPATSALSGWGWGDKILGWLNFNRAKATVDTEPPVVTLDQPNGVLNDPVLSGANKIKISATDALTDVVEGNVEVSVNGGTFGKYDGNLLSDFNYTASRGNAYAFRFQAKDEAGNWSGFATDGKLAINSVPITPSPASPKSGANTYALFPDSPLTPILRWSSFSDADGAGKHDVGGPGSHTSADTQKTFFVEIATDSGFTNVVCPRQGVSCSADSDAGSFTVPGGGTAGALRFDTNYFWRVKVRDNHDLASEFGVAETAVGSCVGGAACAFRSPPSSPPFADFTSDPKNPSIEELVRFTDKSYDLGDPDHPDVFACPRGGCKVVAWAWDFCDGLSACGAGKVSTLQNPTHTYVTKGTYTVKLTATDNDGQTKTITHPVAIRPELPEFKEVLPR